MFNYIKMQRNNVVEHMLDSKRYKDHIVLKNRPISVEMKTDGGGCESAPRRYDCVFRLRGPCRVQSKQHLSLKLFFFLFLFFPLPFFSLFSDIFLPRTSRIKSKNT